MRGMYDVGGLCLIASALAATPAVAQQQVPQPGPTTAEPAPTDTTTPGQPPAAGPQPTTQGDGSPESGTPTEADVVVTGSRIARAGLDTLQPTLVLDNEQIEARGYTNIREALQELPAFGPPGNNPVGAQSSFGPAQTFVNFFSLGSQRTLTLVNGRRFVSANTATIFGATNPGTQVDLNLIPTLLIDRIETIAVGGAPIYGSDAIAGTVNLILQRDFEGLSIDGQYGVSERGDATDWRVRGIAGVNFAGGRGNLTISGEYNTTSGLINTDRPLTAAGNFFTSPADPNSPFAQVLFPNRRITAFTAGGIPLATPDALPSSAGIFGANGPPLIFDAASNLVPLDPGQPTGSAINASGGNGFNLAEVSNLLSPTERYIGVALASFQVTDGVRVFGEAWYANSRGTNLIDQPVYNTALFGDVGDPDGPLQVPLSNPFLTPAARTTIAAQLPAGQDFFYLTRANTDLSSGRAVSTQELYRFVGGLDGSFTLGDRRFQWEVSTNYGEATAAGAIPSWCSRTSSTR